MATMSDAARGCQIPAGSPDHRMCLVPRRRDARASCARVYARHARTHTRTHTREGVTVTRSDRKRIEDALKRFEARYQAAWDDPKGSISDTFGAAADWLRAETKLATAMLDPDETGWTEEKLCEAAILLSAIAREFAKEIRAEAKTL